LHEHERLCTKPHFEKEAMGNSEMAYPPGGDSFIIIMWLIQGHAAGQGMVLASFLGDSPNLGVLYFVICPNQGPKMEGVVLHRVGVLGLFCPKQGQGFKPSAAALPPFPPPRPFPVSFSVCTSVPVCQNSFLFFCFFFLP